MLPVSRDFSDLSSSQQRFIVRWLGDNFVSSKAINKRHTAYGLKQPFTRLFFFVTEEQFAEAMRRAGFDVEFKTNGKAMFNIAQKSPAFTFYRTKGENLDWESVYPE